MTDLGIPGVGDATPIASGGSALVYQAVDHAGQRVAVKVLRGIRGSEVARRFEREQSAAERLRGHPNIINIFGTGVTGAGEPYLVMPLIEGGSLHDELESSGPFATAKAIADVVGAAEAIEYAHQCGILHRDIKPGNILRSADGSIIVTDFGIARVLDAGITSATIGASTPLYAAPELLSENEASVQSEVYSLGALLYALLAGRPAFSASENIWATIQRIRTDDPPPIAGVPAPVMRVIEQAMAKQPQNRPATAGLFAAYLRAAETAAPDWQPPRPGPTTQELPYHDGILGPVAPGQASHAELGATTEAPRRSPAQDPKRAPAPNRPRRGPRDAPPPPALDRPAAAVGRAPTRDSNVLRVVASLAVVALIAGLAWWGSTTILSRNDDSAAPSGPVDTSLPSPSPVPTNNDNDGGDGDPAPDSGLVRFSGDHYNALFPEGWTLLSRDVDVGYGFRSRFLAEGMYLTIDTTPDYRSQGGTDIAASAIDVASGIRSASAVTTEDVAGLALHSFTFRNNDGVESIDIFFEVDGDGYAIVAGSEDDTQTAFDTAKQVALSIRDAA